MARPGERGYCHFAVTEVGGNTHDNSYVISLINSLEGNAHCHIPTEGYFQKQISSMSVGNATGPDGISVQFLRIASR